MKHLFSSVLIFALVLFSNCYGDSLSKGIDTILKNANPNVNIGLVISSINSGKVIYSHRANYRSSPASTLKLFTAITALQYLGPRYRFLTQLMTDGKIINHTLVGNLYIKFSGDPELQRSDLLNLFKKIHQIGIRHIKGQIYIDNFDYNSVPYPPGWMWGDLSYGYAAALDAIIVDHNRFIIHIMPAQKIGRQPVLTTNLPKGVIKFVNRIITTKAYQHECPLTIYSDIHDQFTLHGCINQSWGRQQRTLAIRDPIKYAKVLINRNLGQVNITHRHTIQSKHAPKHLQILASHSSPQLSVIVTEMLKTSDNLTADSLLKKIGQIYYSRQGTWQNGLNAMRKILTPTHINFHQNLINDGAGLSRYNLVMPRQFSRLLYFAYKNNAIRKYLIPALPISGRDGTLAGRMRGIAGRVHAKTGTLTGVSALSGYVFTRHHGVLIFSIMVSGFTGKYYPYRYLEDRICNFLVSYQNE